MIHFLFSYQALCALAKVFLLSFFFSGFIMLLFTLYGHIVNSQQVIKKLYFNSRFLYWSSTASFMVAAGMLLSRIGLIIVENIEPFDVLVLISQIFVIFLFFRSLEYFIKNKKDLLVAIVICRWCLFYSFFVPSYSLECSDPVSLETTKKFDTNSTIIGSPLENRHVALKTVNLENRNVALKTVNQDARSLCFLSNELFQHEGYIQQLETSKTQTLHAFKKNMLLSDSWKGVESADFEKQFQDAFSIQKKLAIKAFVNRFLELDHFFNKVTISQTGVNPNLLYTLIQQYPPGPMEDFNYRNSVILSGVGGTPINGFFFSNLEGLIYQLSRNLPEPQCSYNSENLLPVRSTEMICSPEVQLPNRPPVNVICKVEIDRVINPTTPLLNVEVSISPFYIGINYIADTELALYKDFCAKNAIFDNSLVMRKTAALRTYFCGSHSFLDYCALKQAYMEELLPNMQKTFQSLEQELANIPGGSAKYPPFTFKGKK